MNVSGLCTFELVNLKTSTQNKKVRVQLEIKTASLSGYAELDLPDSQLGQSILSSGFNIDHVIVALVFEKKLDNENAWFELTELKVSTQKLVPILYASYTESQQALIQNQLPQILVPVIDERLAALAKGAIVQFIGDVTGQQGLDERSNFKSK